MFGLPVPYSIVLGIFLATGLLSFVLLLFMPAPYGRFTRPGWGPTLPNQLGWVLMESPNLLVLAYFVATAPVALSAPTWVFLGLYSAHYVYRAGVYPFRLRTPGKRMPVFVFGSAVTFNLFNGYLLGYWFTRLHPQMDAGWFADPRFLLGLALFVGGWWVNYQADGILRNLRKPGETGYKIPRGGLYRFVSCPNYLGESVEWIGYALLTWSVPGAAFACWTLANLLPRALSHHRWYRATFPDYPPRRKAFLPGVL